MCSKKIKTKLKCAFDLSSSVESPIEEKQELSGHVSKSGARGKGLRYYTLSNI